MREDLVRRIDHCLLNELRSALGGCFFEPLAANEQLRDSLVDFLYILDNEFNTQSRGRGLILCCFVFDKLAAERKHG